MFKKWLNENQIEDFDFSAPLFPTADDRKFWSGLKGQTAIVSKAEELLDYSWPTIKATDFMEYMKTGDRMKQENPYFDRRSALQCLVLAELLEAKGRFFPDIVNGIFAVCEETYWGLSAHRPHATPNENIPDVTAGYIDLFVAETASLISHIYGLFYNKLYAFCPEILTRIEYELDRRIITPYLNHSDFFWMGNLKNRVVNNWNPWIISNLLTPFLMVEKSKTRRIAGIKKMLTEVQNYYDALPSDGGCDEGFGYWQEAGARLFLFCEKLYTATKGEIDFFQDEKFRLIGRYAYFAHISENRFVNFADGESINKKPFMSGPVYLYGKRIGDPALTALSKTFAFDWKEYRLETFKYNLDYILYSLIYLDEIEKLDEITPEEKYVLPDLQCSFMRNGKWFYAAKGGHNRERHNHNDVGSFMVFYDSEPVFIDVGRPIYTKKTFSASRYEIWCMQSDWHNLPVINGVSQKDGCQYKSNSFSVDGKTTEISFVSAYNEGTLCQEVSRKISFAENGLEVEDEFVFTKGNNNVSEHFITNREVIIKGNTVIIGGEFVLSCDTKCEIGIEAVSLENEPILLKQWKTEEIKQIKFDFSLEKQKTIKFNLRRIEK